MSEFDRKTVTKVPVTGVECPKKSKLIDAIVKQSEPKKEKPRKEKEKP